MNLACMVAWKIHFHVYLELTLESSAVFDSAFLQHLNERLEYIRTSLAQTALEP